MRPLLTPTPLAVYLPPRQNEQGTKVPGDIISLILRVAYPKLTRHNAGRGSLLPARVGCVAGRRDVKKSRRRLSSGSLCRLRVSLRSVLAFPAAPEVIPGRQTGPAHGVCTAGVGGVGLEFSAECVGATDGGG